MATIHAQVPFDCDGIAYTINEDNNTFASLFVNPTNNSINLQTISQLPADVEIYALGYRRTDNLIYGIGRTNHHLYRIDATGALEDLGTVALETGLTYEAGGIDITGQYFYTTGARLGVDQHLARIDLNDLTVTFLPVAGGVNIKDIAFDPYTNIMWAYDFNNRSFLRADLDNITYTGLTFIRGNNEVSGLYFTAGSRLLAYGTSAGGVAGASFNVDKATGIENTLATGPVGRITDIAACAYSVEMMVDAFPETLFPCEQLDFTYTLGNGTGATITGAVFEHELPVGFRALSVIRNPYGGNVSGQGTNRIRIDNMNFRAQKDSIILRVETDDIAAGIYKSQAIVNNLGAELGDSRRSDFSDTFVPGDSIPIEITRIEGDSIYLPRFGCIGNPVTLDASDFATNIEWDHGPTNSIIDVEEPGQYTITIQGGCQTGFIEFDVVFASCPYTIEVNHETEPMAALPCSEVLYRFYLENDSGLPRTGLSLRDTLPEGLEFIRIERNPFGGTLVPNADPSIIELVDFDLPLGIDTLDILAYVGDINPGDYPNRAVLTGIPPALGPFRLSDDPNTIPADSTYLTVLGVPSDTLFIDTVVCARATLDLNAAPYGFNYNWSTGSTDSLITIIDPGEYNVTILDGCEPSYVFFTVTEGTPIDLEVEDQVTVFLGESHQFDAIVKNEGDSLLIVWTAEVDTTLSCLDCLDPLARPLETTQYVLQVANEVCTDSTVIEFIIDNTRRIYAPNIFSPNRDGINDYFYLQSPDFGIIRNFYIYSRWGSMVHNSTSSGFNLERTGWNGQALNTGKPLEPGVYLWQAEIEFLDGKVETFGGDVMLIR